MRIQRSTLYQIRPTLSDDLRKALDKFGGLSARNTHLSTVLILSITDNVGAALAYRRLISARLQERSRQRSAEV